MRGVRVSLGKGCGLVGSAEALVFWIMLPPLSLGTRIALVATITLASVWIAHFAELYYGKKDDSRIVIDEFSGFLAAALFIPREPIALAAAFMLFRLFDITKPLGIRQLEKLPSGWGCVLDDIASGTLAGLIVHVVSASIR